MLKECPRCLENKPRDKFSKRGTYCNPCTSLYSKEHYHKNKGPYKDRAQQQRRDRTKWINEYKAERGCSYCAERRPWCLAFHHLEPEHKDLGIARAVHSVSMSRLLDEISKCELVCHNCHADIHHTLHLEAM